MLKIRFTNAEIGEFFQGELCSIIWVAAHRNHLFRYPQESKPTFIKVMSAWALDIEKSALNWTDGACSIDFHLERPEWERWCLPPHTHTSVNRLPGLGAPQVEFSRQWTTKNIFVPRAQPASKVFPLVLTFTVTRVCFLVSGLQPAPHERAAREAPPQLQQTRQESQPVPSELKCASNGGMRSGLKITN